MNIVAHNIVAMNAQRQLNMVTNAKQKLSEKMSSGYRINRAADDAAGLAISEKMRAQIRGLNQGAENIADGISYTQVADGALNEVHSMLQRMNELAVQSANGTNSESDRKAIDDEVQQLKTEMQRVFQNTKFNEQHIWPEEEITKTSVWIGKTQVQAVTITTPDDQNVYLNNKNYDKIASDGYTVLADDTGVSLSWKDYDGTIHNTTKIDWAKLEENNYSFQIADYFDKVNDTDLFDGDKPLFDFKVSFTVEQESTIDDIIAAINNTMMYHTHATYLTPTFEDASDATVSYNGVSVSGASITYAAAYASRENAKLTSGETGYDFDNGSDSFIKATTSSTADGNLDVIPENNTADVTTAQGSTGTWSFTFNMEGIGEVKAVSNNISYYSSYASSRAPEDKGL